MASHMTGQWDETGIVLKNLSTQIKPKADRRLEKDGKRVLEQMRGHIDRQDLGWTPLSEETVRIKGHSQVYIDSNWLYSNLEVERRGDSVFIGASSSKTHPKGLNFVDLMRYNEYGTSTQPPRPLIRPTWEGLESEIQKGWLDIFKEIISGFFK